MESSRAVYMREYQKKYWATHPAACEKNRERARLRNAHIKALRWVAVLLK